jgi:hypothetical protein
LKSGFFVWWNAIELYPLSYCMKCHILKITHFLYLSFKTISTKLGNLLIYALNFLYYFVGIALFFFL